MSDSSPIPSSGYSTGCAGGTLASLARHCMPQKQTHQIAMTALRSAARSMAAWVPIASAACRPLPSPRVRPALRRRRRQHRQRHPTGQEKSWQDGRRFPCSGLDAGANGDQLGWSPSRALHAIQSKVAIAVAPTGACSLQTGSYKFWLIRPSAHRSPGRHHQEIVGKADHRIKKREPIGQIDIAEMGHARCEQRS